LKEVDSCNKLEHCFLNEFQLALVNFQDNLGKPAPFWILIKQQMAVVASAAPYANHLHFTQNR